MMTWDELRALPALNELLAAAARVRAEAADIAERLSPDECWAYAALLREPTMDLWHICTTLVDMLRKTRPEPEPDPDQPKLFA